MSNERWKTDGDCTKCRRANYCSKDCSASKRRLGRIIQQAYRDVMNEKYPGYLDVIDKISKD